MVFKFSLYKSIIYHAFRAALFEFFQKTSLNGFGLLYFIRRRKYQRLFWSIFILMGVSSATYVVAVTLMEYMQDPTITSLDSKNVDIWNQKFPAVAVCSVNKISRKAVENFVQEIADEGESVWNLKIWLEKMQSLAGFYDKSAVDSLETANLLQEYINEYMEDRNESIPAFLEKLSPACNELLLRCRWAGKQWNCGDLFSKYATRSGYCCLFNYAVRHDLINGTKSSTAAPHLSQGLGIANGLTLLLNASTRDYFYTDRSARGFVLKIFHPYRLPDSQAGGVRECFISANEDIALELMVTAQVATGEMRELPINKRKCYFVDECRNKYGFVRCGAACYQQCKIEHIRRLCHCLPFYAAVGVESGRPKEVYCNLTHLECLQSYKNEDLSHCTKCLPLCAYQAYNFKKSRAHIKHTRLRGENSDMFTAMPMEEISLVKLYFATSHALYYEKDVRFNWYEILSNIGGVLNICMGCSFISGFEIIYFVVIRFAEKLRKLRQEQDL